MVKLVRVFANGDTRTLLVLDERVPKAIERACKHMAWLVDRDRVRCQLEPDWLPPAYMVTRED